MLISLRPSFDYKDGKKLSWEPWWRLRLANTPADYSKTELIYRLQSFASFLAPLSIRHILA